MVIPAPPSPLAGMALSGMQGLHQPMVSWFPARLLKYSQISFLGWHPRTVGLCSLSFTLGHLEKDKSSEGLQHPFCFIKSPPAVVECPLQTGVCIPDKQLLLPLRWELLVLGVCTPQLSQCCVRRRLGCTPCSCHTPVSWKKAQFKELEGSQEAHCRICLPQCL